jgi:hypothetical protein
MYWYRLQISGKLKKEKKTASNSSSNAAYKSIAVQILYSGPQASCNSNKNSKI